MQTNKSFIPVLIGGCDRSGTTMLGSMLGAHPRCICVPETNFIVHLFRQEKFDPNHIDPLEILRQITKNLRYRLLWPTEIDLKEVSDKVKTGIKIVTIENVEQAVPYLFGGIKVKKPATKKRKK